MVPSTCSTAFLILSFITGLSPQAFADTFGTVRFSGSGCPLGSTSVLATEDAITILFDSFNVSTEESVFRHCILKIPITIATGFAVSMESVDHRGSATLETRTKGFVWSNYALGGREFGTSPITILKGPLEDDFLRRDTTYHRSRRPSCGGDRAITLRVSLYAWVTRSRRARGALNLDSTDGAVSIRLRQDRCS